MSTLMVEECLEQIPNRFQLCAVATKRARQLVRGADSPLPFLGHKATVQSLAEIASGHVSATILDTDDLPLPQVPAPLLSDLDILGESDYSYPSGSRP
jgi:DNA-directed RNA polymerase subunit omega